MMMMTRIGYLIGYLVIFASSCGVQSFVPVVSIAPKQLYSSSSSSRNTKPLHVSIVPGDNTDFLAGNTAEKDDYYVEKENAAPLLRFGSGDKEKIVNKFGLWALAVSLITCPIWLGAMQMLEFVYSRNGDDWDPNRAIYDWTGKVWSKTWLTMTMSYPTYSGEVELIQKSPENGPCLFVANHASWLDIPVLCTVLERSFKFIAKGELGKIPCIGHQLVGGEHILIDREDRRSQLRTFKQGVKTLKNGVPVMAFPEGKRSRDGRLMKFKGGLFAMAKKTGVPIVPITLSHTHAVMPSYSLLPIQSGNGKLHIHVHPAINVDGKTDDEINDLVQTAFLSSLPKYQHPARTTKPEENGSVVEEENKF